MRPKYTEIPSNAHRALDGTWPGKEADFSLSLQEDGRTSLVVRLEMYCELLSILQNQAEWDIIAYRVAS